MRIKVIIQFVGVLNKWYISHANSGQTAFRSTVNGFETEKEAIIFAENNNCKVVSL